MGRIQALLFKDGSMRAKSCLFFVIFLVSCAAVLPAETFWLRYRYDKNASEYLNASSQYVNLNNSKKPEGIALPDFNCAEPLFAKWQTPMDKQGFRWIALDKTPNMRLYDVVYIDTDGDGSLADETPIKRNSFENYHCFMGPAAVIFDTEDGPVSYHLNFEYYSYNDSSKSLRIQSGCWYEGQITLPEGNALDCRLVDYQANGTFNDRSINFQGCDRITFGKQSGQEQPFTGKYAVIDGKYYNFSAAKDGAFIEISAAEDIEFGTVEFQKEIKEFSAGGENGLFFPQITDGKCQLPVGKYRINLWKMLRKDEKGNSWSLKGQWYYNQTGLFEVTKTGAAQPAIGEPIISKLSLSGQQGKQFSISQGLTDGMTGQIELLKNNSRPAAPKVAIRDKTGAYDRTFGLEYG